jgi:hypothetical protein
VFNSRGGYAGLVIGLIISFSCALAAFGMIQRRKADQKKYEEEFDEGGEKEDVFIRVY